jgi:hypothetical protein
LVGKSITIDERRATNMDFRAYLLLHVVGEKSREVTQVLRRKPGVLMADIVEGPPDVIAIIEASERKVLADLTVQALSSVENMLENVRLLPINC